MKFLLKKITKVFISFALLFSVTNISFAETNVTEEDIEMLKALNIYPGAETDKDSFIYALAGFLFDNPQGGGTAEDIARMTGMIGIDESYKNTSNINKR